MSSYELLEKHGINQITHFLFYFFQEAISSCMDQIEVSINLSMSGESFQPSEPSTEGIGSSTAVATSNNPVVAPPTQSMPKVIPQQPSSGYYQSTTPTDLMEVAQTCVY